MSTILYARRVAIVNGDTQECQKLLDDACTKGNTYIYIGIKLQHEIYKSIEIRRICHLSTLEELRSGGVRPSDIVYTTGFGLRSDPILAYATVTLKLQATGRIDRVMAAIAEGTSRPVRTETDQSGAGAASTEASSQTERRAPSADTIRQCRLFYNKNETSGRQLVNALTRRPIEVTLAGRNWLITRVSAREDRILQYSTGSGVTSGRPQVDRPQPGPSIL